MNHTDVPLNVPQSPREAMRLGHVSINQAADGWLHGDPYDVRLKSPI